jgi:hypothetical protein
VGLVNGCRSVIAAYGSVKSMPRMIEREEESLLNRIVSAKDQTSL